MERNEPCRCKSGKKYKHCHYQFDEKILQFERQGHMVPELESIKSKEQIDGIRESGKINSAVLDYVGAQIKAGMCTEEINVLVYEKTVELGGVPAPLNYDGYPKSVCTSLNNEVCHGMPSAHVILQEGDILNVDISTIYNGYFSDSSRMFVIGECSKEATLLVKVAKECLEIGIANTKPWHFLGDMSEMVHNHALQNGCSIVAEFGGHGIGLAFHEEPFVSFVAKKGTEMLLVPGMVFTIEPMVNLGKPDIVIDEENGWTVSSKDGSLSAQWEVTVVVNDEGCEILAW